MSCQIISLFVYLFSLGTFKKTLIFGSRYVSKILTDLNRNRGSRLFKFWPVSPAWHHEYLTWEPLWWCHHPSCQAARSAGLQHNHHQPDGVGEHLQKPQLLLEPLQQLQNPRGEQRLECASLRWGQEWPKPFCIQQPASLHREGERGAGGTLLRLLLPLPEEEVRTDFPVGFTIDIGSQTVLRWLDYVNLKLRGLDDKQELTFCDCTEIYFNNKYLLLDHHVKHLLC